MATIVIGLDPGTDKTGVALGNTITKEAKELAIVKGKLKVQLEEIKNLCKKWKPELVVIGQSSMAIPKKLLQFTDDLEQYIGDDLGVKTIRYNEDYTSAVARIEKSNNEKFIDDIAARIMLSDWLNKTN